MTENNEINLVDTNILIYAYDISEKNKHEIAKRTLEKCWKKQTFYAISTQNLSEFFVNVTKKIQHPIDAEQIRQNIKDIASFSNFKILTIKESTILKAIQMSIDFHVSYWDSLIAAAMQENHIYKIITENNKDFNKIPFVKAINPFSKCQEPNTPATLVVGS